MEALRSLLMEGLNDRESGRVFCIRSVVRSTGTPQQKLADFLSQKLNLEVRAENLHALDEEVALVVATRLFQGWFFKRMSEQEARRLARQFMGAFEPDASWFSTYRSRDGVTFMGTRLLDTSWESGVLVCDSMCVGILWVGDED